MLFAQIIDPSRRSLLVFSAVRANCCNQLLQGLGVHWPAWLGSDYRSALQAAHEVANLQASHGDLNSLTSDVRLAAEGERIAGFRAQEYYWHDLGRPESVAQAARDLESGTITAD